MAGRSRSVSVGNGPRSDLGATNLSASESSILSQAISRAKQLEQEEKEERLGEVFLSNSSFSMFFASYCMAKLPFF